jgi:hypothetical protein
LAQQIIPFGLCSPEQATERLIADFADITHPEFKPGSKKVVRQGWVDACTRRHAKMGTEGWQVKCVEPLLRYATRC